MKEITLRTWHRRAGALVGALLALQALTGFWMSSESALGTLGLIESSFEAHSPYVLSLRAHHGGGLAGALYRVALGLGTLWMAGSGAWILARIRARRREAKA